MGRHNGVRRVALSLTAAVILLVPLACGTGGGAGDSVNEAGELVIDGELVADAALMEAALAEGSVTVYSGVPESIEATMQEEFTAATGIDVVNVRLPSGQLYERILTEHGSGVLEADVVHVSDLNFVEDFRESGISRTHRVAAWDKIPEEYRQDDGHYYAMIIGMMGFAYNTELVPAEEAPRTWKDLLDPRWADEIAMHHAGAGGSSWSWALFQRTTFGEQYWRELAAQRPALYPSTAAITEELVRGEVSIAVNHIGTVNQRQEEGAPVASVYPDDGVTVFPFYTVQTEGSAHPAAADVLQNWTMSTAGARALDTASGEYHPNVDAVPPTVIDQQQPPITDLELVVADEQDWVGLRDEWVAEWNRIYGYTG